MRGYINFHSVLFHTIKHCTACLFYSPGWLQVPLTATSDGLHDARDRKKFNRSATAKRFLAHSDDKCGIKKSRRKWLRGTLLFGAEIHLSQRIHCLFALRQPDLPPPSRLSAAAAAAALGSFPLLLIPAHLRPPEDPITVNTMQSPHI